MAIKHFTRIKCKRIKKVHFRYFFLNVASGKVLPDRITGVESDVLIANGPDKATATYQQRKQRLQRKSLFFSLSIDKIESVFETFNAVREEERNIHL